MVRTAQYHDDLRLVAASTCPQPSLVSQSQTLLEQDSRSKSALVSCHVSFAQHGIMDVAKIATFSALMISFAFVALRAWRNRQLAHGSRPLPGPQGLPFIGSVLSSILGSRGRHTWNGANTMVDLLCVVGTSRLMVYHTGGIFYSTLLGQNVVIISDEKIAYELL